jgi:alkanesulfonate monooxygenase SsuD/methylene tetrahydromethanopterin reductase-like flavin-dependent oxidoreductase (luciferase family)
VSLGQDVSAAADALRGYTALYVGGMGSREQNFYNALVRRMGYEEAAQTVQDLYLDRRPREAAAAVPVELIDETSLLGDRARIADRIQAFAGSGVTTLSISPVATDLPARIATLRTVAEAAELAGVITW